MPTSRRSAAAESANGAANGGGPRVLKKYPNRRLYDTRSSSYITLADVKDMVMSGEAFEVRDAKTGEDLTRSILLQIILEEESGGLPIFSTQMLAQLIRFYGHAMQGMMGAYLEQNLKTFVELQDRMLGHGVGTAGPAPTMTPELWTQVLQGQAPLIQQLMTSYLDQSKNLFAQMQDLVARQTEAMIPSFPGAKR
jgi:polyhydroxyalkanoate synthesis repressor PhaR